MIAFVLQETWSTCFAACLESFLAENGRLMTQQEILAYAPDAFETGTDFGGFAPKNFSLIERAFNLKARQMESIPLPLQKNQSIFVLCNWKRRRDRLHWVRVIGTEPGKFLLMDPGHRSCPHRIKAEEFLMWVGKAFLVEFNLGDINADANAL